MKVLFARFRTEEAFDFDVTGDLGRIAVEEICRANGHRYERDDSMPNESSSFGRCHCGQRIFPNALQRGERRRSL